MVYQLERVLRVRDDFFCSMSASCDDAVLMCGGKNKLFCMCFLPWQQANEVILNMRLYWMSLEGARLHERLGSVSDASWMSHHE